MLLQPSPLLRRDLAASVPVSDPIPGRGRLLVSRAFLPLFGDFRTNGETVRGDHGFFSQPDSTFIGPVTLLFLILGLRSPRVTTEDLRRVRVDRAGLAVSPL
jgi:hypothetical protein